MFPKSVKWVVPLLIGLPLASSCQQLPIMLHLKPSLLCTTKLSYSFPDFESAKSNWRWTSPLLCQALNKQCQLICIWMDFIYSHSSSYCSYTPVADLGMLPTLSEMVSSSVKEIQYAAGSLYVKLYLEHAFHILFNRLLEKKLSSCHL